MILGSHSKMLGELLMLIQCTKKLLKELKIDPSSSREEDDLFSWHANLLTIQRRKTLVLMNDSNRYMIVLYGLKAADFKKVDRLIFQAIREVLKEEGIKDEVVEAYLSQSKEMTFTTTKNKTLVARLNKACENVYFYERELNQHLITQSILSKKASRFLIGNGKNDYTRPNEDLYSNLEKLTDGPIFQSEGIILLVKLNLKHHQVWRRIAIPKHITFPDLHKTLQIVFGWKDYHLHEFSIFQSGPVEPYQEVSKVDRKPTIRLLCHEEAFSYDNEIPIKLETQERLVDYLPANITYTYDFGDDWEHLIVVEEMIDNHDRNHSVCLAGDGNSPPEDVGGEPGFEEFLAIMADKEHPEYENLKSWGKRQGYGNFDIDLVNRRLRNV